MIYLDHHATTPCDQRVVEQMLPWLTQHFGNPHSSSHEFGRTAADAIARATVTIAQLLHVAEDRVLFTSGATESINLAIDGVMRHPRQRRKHLVTTTIEHPAVVDVVDRLQRDGFEVTRVPVYQQGHDLAGQVDLNALNEAVTEQTALVSVHWANNEIGVLQPMPQIAEICHAQGALLHSDATQAVGRVTVDLNTTDVDLLSASAHKFYGPKGVGVLTFGGGHEQRRIRIKPLIIGGGQQNNLRSGTMAPALVVGCAAALQFADAERDATQQKLLQLRSMLWDGLQQRIDGLVINGPPLDADLRLAGNLNFSVPLVEGESWMAACPEVCFSSGSACSSANPMPSHVLRGIGLPEQLARQSVRFGLGKENTADEIQLAVEQLVSGYQSLI
jgi:cysteine desulfurase